MASITNENEEYPDLSKSLNVNNDGQYPDLSKPLSENKVNTFLGEMPAHIPELTMDSPEQKETIDNMIGFAAGAPGMKMVNQAPGLIEKGAKGFYKGIKSLFNQPNAKQVANEVQHGHDVLKYNAEKLFNKVGAKAEERGANLLPVNNKIIEKATQYLPDSEEVRDLISRVKTGDYHALRELQTELGQVGSDYKFSSLPSDKARSRDIFKFRESINDAIHNHLENLGHKDLSNDLYKARESWKKLNDVYYQHPTIAKMVKPKSRKIPNNILNVLSEDSNEMKAIREHHPEVAKAIDNHMTSKEFMKVLKGSGKVGLGIGGVAGGLYGANALKDMVSSLSNIGRSD